MEEALRILIVDDEEELVSALVERLNLRAFQAAGVTSGSAALEYLASSPCDVVLLDVKMPGLGGLDLIRRIKSDHPDLEVILLTGHGSKQDADQGMEFGAFDYLMKPVKIDNLVRILLEAAARKGGGKSNE
ncbi:MAG: response regulator [Gemmatimonadales bacterium]|jgi:DNA-binding NtrC family response regulator